MIYTNIYKTTTLDIKTLFSKKNNVKNQDFQKKNGNIKVSRFSLAQNIKVSRFNPTHNITVSRFSLAQNIKVSRFYLDSTLEFQGIQY